MTLMHLINPMKPLFVLTLALSASAFAAPVTIRHDFGSTTIPTTPKRVVVISDESAELAAVLGVKPVGFASARVEGAELGRPFSKFRSATGKLLGQPIFVGSSLSPSVEAVLALKPDLIIVYANDAGKSVYTSLSKIAPTLAFSFDVGTSGWRGALLSTARALGKTTQANRYLATFDARVRTVRTDLASLSSKAPNTALLYMFNADSVMALGEKFSFSGTLAQLGLKLAMPDGVKSDIVFSVLSPEALVGLKADRAVLLRLTVNGRPLPRNNMDDLLKRSGVKLVTYLLNPEEPSSGPITDLKRVEALAKSLK